MKIANERDFRCGYEKKREHERLAGMFFDALTYFSRWVKVAEENSRRWQKFILAVSSSPDENVPRDELLALMRLYQPLDLPGPMKKKGGRHDAVRHGA